jgi:hypothetical protein
MTTQTTTRLSGRSILVSLGDTLAAIADTLAETGDLARCSREAERLFALSDEELARRGLTRDRVINYAFRHYISL